MNWTLPKDNTAPVITAEKHIHNRYGNTHFDALPKTCVIFEIGMAMDFLESNFQIRLLFENWIPDVFP